MTQPRKEHRVQVALSDADDARLNALSDALELSAQAVIRFYIRQAYEALATSPKSGPDRQLRLFQPTLPDNQTPVPVPVPQPPPAKPTAQE